jgi:hypothetical protein
VIACPTCGGPTVCRETKPVGNYTRRRRICIHLACPGRVTTIEVAIDDVPTRKLGEVVVVPKRVFAALAHMLGDAIGRDAAIALLVIEPDGDVAG